MIQLLKMHIIYTFFILLSDFAYAEKIAVNPVLNFKKIDSLPLVGSYGGAVIDSGGWLWLSSDSYLYRTNGDITYTYDLNKKNSAHLLDVPISMAFIDSKSRMGFGSFKGLSFYNPEANTFRHIIGDTSKIDKIENGYPHGMINTYFQDSAGREWLGHVRYLTLYNPDAQTFTNFSPWESEVNADTDALGALYPGISDIEEADDGSLWLSTVRNGLLKFDPDSGTYEIYRTFRPSDIYIKQIYALEWHSAAELILATSDGLVLFNLNSKQFSRYPEHSPFLGQLNNVKQSRLGGYWITAGSLYHLSKEGSVLKYPMKGWAGPLIEQSDGTVVVTFGSGHTYATSPEMNQVNFFDLETESIGTYAQDGEVIYLGGKERIIKYSLKNNLIESIKLPVNDCQVTALQVEKGSVFAAGCGQFFIIDKYNRKKITTVSIPINSNRSLYNYVSKIVSIGNDKLWLSAANFGLLEFDKKTKKFNILKEINAELFLENFASQSVEVSGSLAIVSTQARGFSFINVNSKKILTRHDPNKKNYPLPIRMIKELIKVEGAIYILHNSSSISKIDVDNMTAEAQALPFGSPLFCGSNDKGEALYYSDDRNIYTFKKNVSTLKFDQNNGMRNDVTVSSCFIYNNELFLVGNQGLLRAKLDEKTDYRKPKVNFTKLYINHREIPVNSDILPASLDYTDSITLDFNQRTIALEFTSTQLTPAQTNYYYKLDGYDSDWISSSKPRAQYTQIPWGRYVFRVKSEKNKLPSEERAIDIIVGAPWWIAWYMQCIYLILIVAFIWLFRNFSQIERKRLAALVKSRTSEIEKMNRQQKELYENLSHELNSPLTGINAIAHSVSDEQQSQRLFWHTMSMQKLIRQILDISRWANSHRLEKFRTDIGEIASELVQSFHDSIQEKNI